ncbi:MAG: hypothetical protein WCR45_03525 [Bacteroidaceae bacterium]
MKKHYISPDISVEYFLFKSNEICSLLSGNGVDNDTTFSDLTSSGN